MYQIGKLQAPVTVLAGDGSAVFRLRRRFQEVPSPFHPEIEDLILRNTSRHEAGGSYNGKSIRLEDWRVVRPRNKKNRPVLFLTLSHTTFFAHLTCNIEIDRKVFPVENETVSIRERFIKSPREIIRAKHVLSNFMDLGFTIVTRDQKVILTKRSQRVAINPGMIATFTECSDLRYDLDSEDIPDFSFTATRGAFEEVGIYIPPSRFQFLGFVVGENKLSPGLLAVAHTDHTWVEIMERTESAQDVWEGKVFAIDFSPEVVRDYIEEIFSDPQSGGIYGPSVVNLVFGLIQTFGKERIEHVFGS